MTRSLHQWFVNKALRGSRSVFGISLRAARNQAHIRARSFVPGSDALPRLVLGALIGSAVFPAAFAQYTPDPGCNTQEAWWVQINPRTDPIGKNNIAFPLDVATYWATEISGSQGSSVTIEGQFPAARYMSLQIYDSNQNVLGDLPDNAINPDPGQNNPYRSGSSAALGTYTVQLFFGQQPAEPPANTLYTGGATPVIVIYRVYYPDDYLTNSADLTGGAFPALPTISVAGVALPSCPPRPVVNPQTSTVWGRLDQNAFVGVPTALPIPAFNPPLWILTNTNSSTPDYPNLDNKYMAALLSRKYLTAPYNNDLVVVQMRAPTFTDTQAGVPPYANADMRFWSICTDEPLSTGVVRCMPDDQASKVNGLVTFVISDPSNQPSASVLTQWGASWLPWGALAPSDYVYDAQENILNNGNGVYYYDFLIYRQTGASPAFIHSIANVSQMPLALQPAAMGEYWPEIGYCKLQDFQTLGPACVSRSQ
jgi:hypothetical protein